MYILTDDRIVIRLNEKKILKPVLMNGPYLIIGVQPCSHVMGIHL